MKYILEVKILRDRSKKSVSISQEQYIKKILEQFRMQDCKPIDTPMAKSETLSRRLCPKTSKEKEQMSKVLYLSAVGSLMYAMMCIRSDICHSIGMTSRYQSNLG